MREADERRARGDGTNPPRRFPYDNTLVTIVNYTFHSKISPEYSLARRARYYERVLCPRGTRRGVAWSPPASRAAPPRRRLQTVARRRAGGGGGILGGGGKGGGKQAVAAAVGARPPPPIIPPPSNERRTSYTDDSEASRLASRLASIALASKSTGHSSTATPSSPRAAAAASFAPDANRSYNAAFLASAFSRAVSGSSSRVDPPSARFRAPTPRFRTSHREFMTPTPTPTPPLRASAPLDIDLTPRLPSPSPLYSAPTRLLARRRRRSSSPPFPRRARVLAFAVSASRTRMDASETFAMAGARAGIAARRAPPERGRRGVVNAKEEALSLGWGRPPPRVFPRARLPGARDAAAGAAVVFGEVARRRMRRRRVHSPRVVYTSRRRTAPLLRLRRE